MHDTLAGSALQLGLGRDQGRARGLFVTAGYGRLDLLDKGPHA